MTRHDFLRRLRRVTKPSGYVLMAFLGILVLLAATSATLVASAVTSNRSSVSSRTFIQSGQALDEAISQAIYDLNQGGTDPLDGTYPTQASPSGLDVSHGKWTWWLDAPTVGQAGLTTKLHVTGKVLTATRSATINLYSASVSSVSQKSDTGAISYSVAPKTAWTHAIAGRSISVTGLPGTTASTTIDGAVGLYGNSYRASDFAGNPANATDGVYRYGPDAKSVNFDAYDRPLDVATDFTLDKGFAQQQLDQCQTSTASWTASEHGGRLYANGNLGCYSTMTFDVPTTIVGSGTFTAIVSGDVNIASSISASAGQLNLLAAGDSGRVQFTGNPAVHAFIFAPGRTCSTQSGTYLTYTGSIVCDTVTATGRFTGETPQHDDSFTNTGLYNRTIWYLGTHDQTSGEYEG